MRSIKKLLEDEGEPEKDAVLINEQAIYVKDFDLKNEADRVMFLDQTGRFPVTDYKRNQYVMVLYETTSNNIMVEAMQSRCLGKW